jgi:DNA polymerase-3 subunit beta
MKLTILQENLAKSLNLAARFSSTRSQLPILGNILLSASKTKLKVASTNLEISVSSEVGAKIEEEGELTIPSKVISEIVANLPKGSIELQSDKEQLKISTSGFSSKVLGMNSADFPKIPGKVDTGKALVISKKELSDALPKVLFSASVDETRPVLTGALFILEKTSLTVVATDGFRLSKKKINLKTGREGRVIVPKGVLNELLRLVQEADEVLFDIEEKEKQVIFGIENIILTSRLIEGDYPDFEKIIPASSTIKVLIDKEELLRAVKLASIFARESFNIVKLALLKDSVKVLAESSSSGSQETKVDAKVEGDIGKDFEIAFNFHFLEEFLHSVIGDEVKMEFTTTTAAGIFRDSDDDNYLHLIMPVKLQT